MQLQWSPMEKFVVYVFLNVVYMALGFNINLINQGHLMMDISYKNFLSSIISSKGRERILRIIAYGFLLGCVSAYGEVAGTANARGTTSGAYVYARQCLGCHGPKGDGNGGAATYLFPRPRNYTQGKFEFGGSIAEIKQRGRYGIPGTAMPSFAAALTEDEIAAVAAYVRHFVPGKTPAAFVPPSPPAGLDDVSRISRGAALYSEACVACHGSEGLGNGPAALGLTDTAGNPIRPRNLVAEPLEGGERPADIYSRIHQGIPTNPMPAFGDTYSTSQLWDIVAYVKSLRKDLKFPVEGPDSLVGKILVAGHPKARHGGVAAWSLDDPAWANAHTVTLTLHPLWDRPSWPQSLEVQTLTNASTIAFLFSWVDATPHQLQGSTEDFHDAVAVEFPQEASSMPPYVGMGGSGEVPHGVKPQDTVVRILQWRAVIPGPQLPARTHRDKNPWEDQPFATPARAAGNPLAAPARAVAEYVEAGFGTLTYVPNDNMYSESRWDKGRWQVLITRSRDGVPSLSKSSTWAAFAVWDGAAGDRNGQKSVTRWIRLKL